MITYKQLAEYPVAVHFENTGKVEQSTLETVLSGVGFILTETDTGFAIVDEQDIDSLFSFYHFNTPIEGILSDLNQSGDIFVNPDADDPYWIDLTAFV